MTGKELKEVRQRIHLSQTEFGKKLGYHHPQIRMSEFEHGVRKIPFRVQLTILRIKKYLDNVKSPKTRVIEEKLLESQSRFADLLNQQAEPSSSPL
jgi:transcriptional regulator with XRE-family HTH domain